MNAERERPTPQEIRELAEIVRGEGFDSVAEWLEENAEEGGA